jgi:hypothetical protein
MEIVMRWLLATLLAIHGLIHGMGVAKAFGFAALPQLTQPLSREIGMLWLAAGVVMLASAVTIVASPRHFWIVGALALIASQAAITTAWRDASFGTIVNVALLLAVVYGWLTEGPSSFRAEFEKDIAVGLARPLEAPVVTEASLTDLPEPVRRYLRATGVVGQPSVQNYQVRFSGRIRSGPAAHWMPFDAVQHSFADQPTRLFLMRARLFAVPVQAFHRMSGGHATMRVTVAGAIPMVDAHGEVMDRSETVTLFNDMCIFAPGTLLGPGIAWEELDARTVRARFTNGDHTIAATLFFGDDGLLTNFMSDDRSRSSADGKQFTPLRFTTPVRNYRNFGPARLAAHGEARWRLPEGEFTYVELDLHQVTYNIQP